MAKLQAKRIVGEMLQHKNGTRANCPNCYTLSIRWRIRQRSYICNRCGQVFDQDGNMLPAKPERN
jgi:DNA-directed RNA polymerase subunit RPC12/RpoP